LGQIIFGKRRFYAGIGIAFEVEALKEEGMDGGGCLIVFFDPFSLGDFAFPFARLNCGKAFRFKRRNWESLLLPISELEEDL
jgi:hypothetical protein